MYKLVSRYIESIFNYHTSVTSIEKINLSLTDPMRNSGVKSATSLRWFCNKQIYKFKL